ncbi:MAG: hypothetical protein IH939_15610 [Acidobacteria bacterium]|nr:hypothetical protein [Acidobacteriota bacterium]
MGPESRNPQPEQASLEGDLRRFEAELHQLEIEYTKFFAGARPRPPVELRARVEALIRRWDRVPIQGSSERYRYNTLQLRFRTFANLWDRGLRAREEGRPGPFSRTS